MTGRWLTVAAFALCILSESMGQRYLLFHKNRNKEAKYYVGDALSFELKGQPWKVTRVIRQVTDSLIVFGDFSIRPNELNYLYYDDKTRIWFVFRTKYERLCYAAGALYLFSDAVNTQDISPGTLKISAAFLGAGLLARWLIPKKFKIGRTVRMVIMR